MSAKSDIKMGRMYPFDASDAWWSDIGKAPQSGEWSIAAARGIVSNLRGRQGIEHALDPHTIDERTRAEIIEDIAAIIRYANAAK